VGLLVVAIVSGPSTETAQNGEKPEQGEEKKKPAAKKKNDPQNVAVNAGQTAELQDRTLVVNEVQRNYTPPNRFTRVEPGNELIRLYIIMQNTGHRDFNYNIHDFQVQDSNGVQKHAETITELPNRIGFGDLAPGGTLEGNLVYQVPQGDNGLSLVYETDIISKRTITVQL